MTKPLAYDPEKLTINRKRFSTTQGEVELIYAGQRIEQYGDTITLDPDGKWRGMPDHYWHSVAADWLSDQSAPCPVKTHIHGRLEAMKAYRPEAQS